MDFDYVSLGLWQSDKYRAMGQTEWPNGFVAGEEDAPFVTVFHDTGP
jgi:hypothetical protein